ncbi:hypothetical protein Tco_0654269 [Tanacetum coccineum]|uniref:Uncharacterized protein n=1 Tax=Tanacetum coccineum TaxID=301880 RepID=A0ABQ4X3M1_9ASTR
MAPLPPREQRHPFLRYQGLEYTDADIVDFEERLERIFNREIHRVQVVDFQGMPELMRDGLFGRMRMEHREYEMWEIRIKQYFQIQDYALWEVIENGNSWVPIPITTPESGSSTALKMTVPSTTESKRFGKKNDVKAESSPHGN